MSDLVSGEAVLLELRVARLASRGLAFALDVLLQFAALTFTFLLLRVNGVEVFDTALNSAVGLLILVAVLVGYPALMETLSRGRTVGKIALGLRVVRSDGGPIQFRHALVRALAAFFVDFWALGFFGAVAVIVSLCSKQGQRVGDMLAGTLVVRERVPPQRATMVHMPPPLAGWAADLRLSGLPNDLALAVRQYLGRVHELSPEAAASLGYRLAMDVSTRLGTPVPPGVPVQAYLTAVLAERRNREAAQLWSSQPANAPGPPAVSPGQFNPSQSNAAPPADPQPAAASEVKSPEPGQANNPFTPPS